MNKLILERIGMDVFCNGKKLTRVDQSTKGPDKEVIKIEGLENSNGQKWVSLKNLNQGINELECRARDVTIRAKSSTESYTLTTDEQREINDLRERIDLIISDAKKRFIPKPDLSLNPVEMTEEQRLAKIEELKRYYGLN